jgi:20S proteasome subunit beta 3
MSYNGSAVIAMVGHNCVAICSDLRLGVSQQTLATDFQKVLVLSGVGCGGICSTLDGVITRTLKSRMD